MKELHRTPKANATHTHAQSDITNLTTNLAAKAPLASPALTGTPTAPTAAAGTNNTQVATTQFVKNAVDTATSGKQNTITGAASTITNTNLTASMVMITNSDGKAAASDKITVNELNALNGWTADGKGNIYPRITSMENLLDGATSNIQSQIDAINAGIYPSFNTSQELEHNVAFTPTVNGLLHYMTTSDARSGGYSMYITIGNATFQIKADDYSYDTGFIPVAAGTVIKYTYDGTDYKPGYVKFYPCS